MGFEMPTRTAADGRVEVGVAPGETIRVAATHGEVEQSMVVSRYNAARILTMLCFMLEVPYPKPLGKLPM